MQECLSVYEQIVFFLLHFVLYGIPALVIARFKTERVSYFYAYFGFLYVFTQLFAVLYSIQLGIDLTITGGNIAYSSLILITMIILFITHDATVVRNLIVIQIILNIFLYFLYMLLTVILLNPSTINIFSVPAGLFSTTIDINIISSCVFVFEVLLMFYSLEKAKKIIKNMALLVVFNIFVFIGILCLDGFIFPFFVMFFDPVYGQYIVGGVIGKLIISLGFSPFLLLFFVLFRKQYGEYITATISIKNMLVPTRAKLLEQLTEIKTKLVASETNYLAAYKEAKLYKDMFTHDIANIIQSILFGIRLYDQEGTLAMDKSMETIRLQVDKAIKLIENVRKLSSIEEKLAGLEVKDVIVVIKAVIDDLMQEFHDKIEIEINSAIDTANVRATDFLTEIFKNILSNAIKYNDSQIPRVDIQVSIDKESFANEKVKIEFIDNGIGIPDEKKALIFSENHRDLKSGKGMGLALSLIVKALEMFGGDIHVEDRVVGDFSQGSDFVIRIPRYHE